MSARSDDPMRAPEAVQACWWLWPAGRDAHFRAIADGIPALIALRTPAGDVEMVNRHALEYFNATLEQLKGWATADTIHPEDVPAFSATWRVATESGRPCEIACRQRRADGVYRWFHMRGFPLLDPEGRIALWYILEMDIDERKRSEEALRRSQAFLAQAQHMSSTGAFSWRVATGDILWSEEAFHIFGLDPAGTATLDGIRSRVHPEDHSGFEEMLERARDGRDFTHDHRLLMPDNSVKYVHVVAHGTRDVDGKLEYIGAIQDVTQHRLAEAALDKVRSELAHVARVTSLGALTASIAHEVNQPLSGIITNASTCLRMLAAEPPNVLGARETARRTIRDGHRASDVITRLRALFSKKAAVIELVDLNEAAGEVIALSWSELQRSRVILRAELTEDLPPVAGDRVQLQQVILNLLLNASDALRDVNDRPRHVVIRTELEAGGGVRVAVQDSGVGVEPQALEQLFEAFYTTKPDGMGMGLSISRSIIDRHHGQLWATPNEGPGVTFTISLPAASGVALEGASAAAPHVAQVATGGHGLRNS